MPENRSQDKCKVSGPSTWIDEGTEVALEARAKERREALGTESILSWCIPDPPLQADNCLEFSWLELAELYAGMRFHES